MARSFLFVSNALVARVLIWAPRQTARQPVVSEIVGKFSKMFSFSLFVSCQFSLLSKSKHKYMYIYSIFVVVCPTNCIRWNWSTIDVGPPQSNVYSSRSSVVGNARVGISKVFFENFLAEFRTACFT